MQDDFPKHCSACGRILPSKYAIAGVRPATGGGADAVFCAFCWHADDPKAPQPQTESSESSPMEPIAPVTAAVHLTVEQKKNATRAALDAISKLGSGVAGMVKKLAGVQDPQELIDSFDASLEANKSRRAPLSARHETLFAEIAAKKKVWQAAPAARRKLLEMELRTLLAEYQGVERQLAAFFENERMLIAVRARVEETVALEMRKVSERQIDRISDKLDDAVSGAEAALDAISDLERAGARRDQDSPDSLEEALAGFETGEKPPVAAISGFDGISGEPVAPEVSRANIGVKTVPVSNLENS